MDNSVLNSFGLRILGTALVHLYDDLVTLAGFPPLYSGGSDLHLAAHYQSYRGFLDSLGGVTSLYKRYRQFRPPAQPRH